MSRDMFVQKFIKLRAAVCELLHVLTDKKLPTETIGLDLSVDIADNRADSNNLVYR